MSQKITFVAITVMSALVIAFEFFYPSVGPLIGLSVCAAALGWLLPQRMFLLLVSLLLLALAVPPIVSAMEDPYLVRRILGGISITLLVAVRFAREGGNVAGFPHPVFASVIGPNYSRHDSRRGPKGTEFSEEASILPIDLSVLGEISSESDLTQDTELHQTAQSDQREREQFSLDANHHASFVEPAIARLRASGKFNAHQMKLITSEMRNLEEHGLVADFARCVPAGTQIGRFIVSDALGRGGEGNVYRGYDANGESGAIKVLHNMKVSDRFRREMHLVRQLAHPNIVTAYEVGEFCGLPFITMELLEGPDLYARVKKTGVLPWLEATHYVLQASRALSHAHERNLVHRDVKPGNLIMHGQGRIKLVDLGLAAMGEEAYDGDSIFRFETQDGHLAGTLPYMAPEQARSLANATVRSDIYGLGATWFYLLTGRERLHGNTFSEQFESLLVSHRFSRLPRHLLPHPLARIYRRMVAYDVSERYRDCRQLSADIEKALRKIGEDVHGDAINLLVVEDSRTDMLFTLEMLRRTNSTLVVNKANTLQSAIELCQSAPVDLVLLDLWLPDSSGVETVLRFREAVHGIPLVVLSGMSKAEIGAECLAAGADTFISKNGLTAHRVERSIFVTLSRRSSSLRQA